ncbi:g10365 [Coccomyxa viridis]|uniref:G10365 protein n=1 Tax=Coccomyxa viridis TaxID=1274662 RepID=A0ABP1G6I7_9CHLO
MGKHNGKARAAGLKVGGALANRHKGGPGKSGTSSRLHTTEQPPAMVSVLEANDLTEMMSMAELAERDFAADRGEVIVISTGAVEGKVDVVSAQERKAAEDKNRHKLRIPRRPQWSERQSGEEVDAQERAAFLQWRRALAAVEEAERLVLTPFEKNLEVWRQLWRVVERSHIVVQVLDARDPLRYRSEDLEAFAREANPAKASLMLLNKADLLPQKLRASWAAYFQEQGVDFIFWSAKAASEQTDDSPVQRQPDAGTCTEVVSADGLVERLHERAQAAVNAGSTVRAMPTSEGGPGRLMVGLTGYPNVGKSSTINALFGSKKTAVAATPGKTKHFQTLNITERMTLCDCPGLVLPKFAASKAEMVAAGVIPIDRLTDVRAPTAVICQRISRQRLEEAYNVRLPKPSGHEAASRPPTSAELLRAVALARGWVVGNGLPDEARAGRLLLKDYTSGKLTYCEQPPNTHAEVQADAAYTGHDHHDRTQGSSYDPSEGEADSSAPSENADDEEWEDEDEGDADGGDKEESEAEAHKQQAVDSTEPTAAPSELGDADLDLLASLNAAGLQKQKRAEHKFQKKIPRTKGNRGQLKEGGTYDGSALHYGRRGGLVRVHVAQTVT